MFKVLTYDITETYWGNIYQSKGHFAYKCSSITIQISQRRTADRSKIPLGTITRTSVTSSTTLTIICWRSGQQHPADLNLLSPIFNWSKMLCTKRAVLFSLGAVHLSKLGPLMTCLSNKRCIIRRRIAVVTTWLRHKKKTKNRIFNCSHNWSTRSSSTVISHRTTHKLSRLCQLLRNILTSNHNLTNLLSFLSKRAPN
jgi:hypothetical protein